MDSKAERLFLRLIDVGERLFIVLLFAGLAIRICSSLRLHPYNALLLVSEGLLIVLVLIRRDAGAAITTRPLDWIIAILGTTLPLLVRPGGTPLAPPLVGSALMLGGLAISVWAQAYLRMSYGVAAANRGVVEGGPYRFVRHPMYAGYFVTFVGFLLVNPLAWNLAVYLLAAVFQVARIFAEEAVLSKDPAYAAMMQRVRHRLIPRVF